jgi:hypothetical protein
MSDTPEQPNTQDIGYADRQLIAIEGLIDTVTSVPTHTPTKFEQQVKLYTDSLTSPNEKSLYIYSNKAQSWFEFGFSGAGIFGDGNDGAVTFDGSSTILGLAPSSSVYTLTRDIYPTTMTVNSGVTIRTGGYRIFAKISVTNNGTINNTGGNGETPNAGDADADAGAASGGGFFPGGSGGGQGLRNNGGQGGNLTPTLGGRGGTGGNGSVGTGGNAGTVNATTTGFRHFPVAVEFQYIDQSGPTATVIKAGTGGGGGGGDNASESGGGGGGGGGFVVIASKSLTNTGTISANGGNGGNGSSGGNAGGGGGGGGGVVSLVYSSLTNSGTISANGGTGGTKNGTGTNGANGSNGTVIQIKI